MSNWSRSAAQWFTKRKEAKGSEGAKPLSDLEIAAAKASVVWDALCKDLELKCSEFNSEPGTEGVLIFDGCDPRRLEITRTDNQASLRVTYLSSLRTVRVEGLNEHTSFSLRLIGGSSEVGLFKRNVDEHLRPEDISTAIMDMFLEMED